MKQARNFNFTLIKIYKTVGRSGIFRISSLIFAKTIRLNELNDFFKRR